MATALASMLFKPVTDGLRNEYNFVKQSGTKRFTMDRLKILPEAIGAFGKGFIGINDYDRAPNNHESTRGAQLR